MGDLTWTVEFLATPTSLGLMALGTALGVTVGAVPGLTGAMLIARALPLTFAMRGESENDPVRLHDQYVQRGHPDPPPKAAACGLARRDLT